MKKIFFLIVSTILLFNFVACNKDKEYTITGKFSSSEVPKKIYLYDIDMKKLDSTTIEKASFSMKGHVEQPKKVILGDMESKTPLAIVIFLENSNFTIEITDSSYDVKGGEIQQLIYGFYETEEYKSLMTEYETVSEQAFSDSTNTMAEKSNKLIKSLEDRLFEIEFKSFRNILEGDYPTNTKLLALSSTQDWRAYPPEKQLKMLDEYEKELGENILIDNHRKYLTTDSGSSPEEDEAGTKEPLVGSDFMEIEASDIDGNKMKLSEVISKNNYVILEFWASWCSPCRAEIPNLKQAYDKYKSKGLEIYSVSLDDKVEKWLEASQEENSPWLNLHAPGAFKSKAATDYGISGIPAGFLISKEGKIVAKAGELRGGFLNKTLNKFLK